jgi:hypothetical protein
MRALAFSAAASVIRLFHACCLVVAGRSEIDVNAAAVKFKRLFGV